MCHQRLLDTSAVSPTHVCEGRKEKEKRHGAHSSTRSSSLTRKTFPSHNQYSTHSISAFQIVLLAALRRLATLTAGTGRASDSDLALALALDLPLAMLTDPALAGTPAECAPGNARRASIQKSPCAVPTRSRSSALGGSSLASSSRVESSSKALRTEEKVWRGGRLGEASMV